MPSSETESGKKKIFDASGKLEAMIFQNANHGKQKILFYHN
jgi:hypothetical protein